MRALIRLAAALVDFLAIVLALAVLWIITTGGAVIYLRGARVSLTGVDNPLLALSVVAVLRCAALPAVGLLFFPSLTPAGLAARASRYIGVLSRRVGGISPRRAARGVTVVLLASLAAKLLLAYANPGFFSGDDVEVQEMVIRALRHADWPVWDLRNAFFPMTFVYPFEWLASVAGATSPETLVFSGRAAVAILSSAAVWGVWLAARDEMDGASGWAMIAAIAFATSKLAVAFGSSELPRPVASVALLGAFVLLKRPRAATTLAAAALLGIASCFRFSEALFIGVAAAQLCAQRQIRLAILLVIAGAVTTAAILAAADYWYWGEPFHSTRAAIDYTLVKRLSSRGYQGPAWYATHALEWLNPAVFIFAVVALWRTRRPSDLWAWAPMLVLSCLPHKEARYMIPAVPFFCIAATRGLKAQIERLDGTARDAGTRPWTWQPLALLAIVVVGIAQDAGHWRLPRTNADVAFARQAAAAIPPGDDVAVEQGWRAGGRLYLAPRAVIDLDPGRLNDPAYVAESVAGHRWLVLDGRSTAQAPVAAALPRLDYTRMPLNVAGSRYQLWQGRRR